MAGCRIGKVKFKSGGQLHLLPEPTRVHCDASADNFRRSIGPTTKAAIFIVLDEDGSAVTGFSYESGTALAEMLGCAEVLKDDIYEHWDTPNEPIDKGA